MKLSKNCYECLRRLVFQAAELATDDAEVRSRAVEAGCKVLGDSFSQDEVSVVVATKVHEVIKKITGNPDPYQQMKQREIEIAIELYNEMKSGYGNDFKGLLKLAALGNTLDFFRPFDVIKDDMRCEVKFAIDDSEKFEARLRGTEKILYLADNAGEVFFDLPLVRWVNQFTSVTYVVKSFPVQNDITLEDVRKTGLEADLGNIITTGTATPGIIFSLASTRFKREFEFADLIFAKGMGYYESLTELPAEGRVFYCLKAKCQPVADSLNVPVNSFVAMLR